jgi:putative Mg2+ transporter-C (MgtC) family protein
VEPVWQQVVDRLWFGFLLEGEWILRLVFALVLGGVLGLERERKDLPAGLRTFMLVSLGSCLFTILSLVAFPGSETARIAAQVVVGIGFIGAGTVLKTDGPNVHEVRGLTTAAGMWSTAAIGMAVGAGYYWLALSATVLVLTTLALLKRVEERLL